MSNDKDVKRIIHYFRERDEVSTLYLFGSLSKGRKTKESDIDIAVLIDESKLKKRGFEPLKKKYYAASPTFSMRPVDIVILNTAPPFLKHQVLKTGRLLFDRNRKLRVRFTERAITEYLDYKPIEDIYLKAIARRFRVSSKLHGTIDTNKLSFPRKRESRILRQKHGYLLLLTQE